jgi:hypothetical protein
MFKRYFFDIILKTLFNKSSGNNETPSFRSDNILQLIELQHLITELIFRSGFEVEEITSAIGDELSEEEKEEIISILEKQFHSDRN